MRPSIVVLPSAQLDIQKATDWYENKQIDLGKRFKKQVVKAISSLNDPRIGYGPAYMNLSRIFVEKFPFSIYFKENINRNKIVVYAVLHKKQDKETILRQRL